MEWIKLLPMELPSLPPDPEDETYSICVLGFFADGTWEKVYVDIATGHWYNEDGWHAVPPTHYMIIKVPESNAAQ